MLEGFMCPQHGERPGSTNSIHYCIAECTKQCTAPHVLAAMMIDEDTGARDANHISVTMLSGGCKRKTLMERLLPFYSLPSKRLPTFRGRLVHGILEGGADYLKSYEYLIEVPLQIEVTSKSGTWILRGMADAIDKVHKVLYDNKTLQDYAFTKLVTGSNDGTWSKHIPDQYVKQLNLYKYMAEKEEIAEIIKLQLQLISFGQLVLTGTKPIVGLKRGYKWSEEEYDIPEVPILPTDEIEHIIQTEGDMWYRIIHEGERAPPRDNEWAWLCKHCNFLGTRYCPDPIKELKQASGE